MSTFLRELSSTDIGVIALARALEIQERGGKDIRDMPCRQTGHSGVACTRRFKSENDIKCKGEPVSTTSPHVAQEDGTPPLPLEERERADEPESLSCEGYEKVINVNGKRFEGTGTVETFSETKLETKSELQKETDSPEGAQVELLLEDKEEEVRSDGKNVEGTIDALLETVDQLEMMSSSNSSVEGRSDDDICCENENKSYNEVPEELLEEGENNKKKHVSWKRESISPYDMAEGEVSTTVSSGGGMISFNDESAWPPLGVEEYPQTAESSSSLGKCLEMGEKSFDGGDKLTSSSSWAERMVQALPESSTRRVPISQPKDKLLPCRVMKGVDVSEEDRGGHPTISSGGLMNNSDKPAHAVQPVTEREGEENVDNNNQGSGTKSTVGRFLGKNGMLRGEFEESQTIAGKDDDDPEFGEWIHPEGIDQIIAENPVGIGLSLHPTIQVQSKEVGGSDGSVIPSPPVPEKSSSNGAKTTSSLNKRQMKRRRYQANAINRCKTGCVTTDMTVQNVLMLMCLAVVGGGGRASSVIRHTRQWVLYCTACYRTTTPDPSRIFCPICGNTTLDRVACSTDAVTGVTKLHFRKNRQSGWDKRGSKYPLPAPGKPKKGKDRFSGGLLLREDQLMQGIWAQKVKTSKGQNSNSIFGQHITESVGISANKGRMGSDGKIVVGFGKGNPNASKKGKGRERRGKTKRG